MNLFYPNNNTGSHTFILYTSGSTKSKGLPFTFINPFPVFTVATATAFFFSAKTLYHFYLFGAHNQIILKIIYFILKIILNLAIKF